MLGFSGRAKFCGNRFVLLTSNTGSNGLWLPPELAPLRCLRGFRSETEKSNEVNTKLWSLPPPQSALPEDEIVTQWWSCGRPESGCSPT